MHYAAAPLALSLVFAAGLAAEPIFIPNHSFELPTVSRNVKNPFGALPLIADWDENGVGGGDELNQNTGVFLNTEPGEPDHVSNPDQKQLAFLSTLIGNAIRQELADEFVPGRTYTLTAAVATSLTFPAGATEQLEIALFYFNGGVEQVVASTFVSGSEVTATSLIDATATLPEVSPDDAWAGKRIGVLIRPAINDPDDEEGEGFWDLDNVRLEVEPPVLGFLEAAILADCLSGPENNSLGINCAPIEFEYVDLDADDDVDLLDYAEFQSLFWPD